VRGKQQAIEKLHHEILSMTVKKELLSSAIEKVNHRHQEQLEQIGCQQREIEAKISQYAVLAPAAGKLWRLLIISN
jgi:Ni,Fe-hydrogenase III component G